MNTRKVFMLAAGVIACLLIAFVLVQGARLLGGPQPATSGGAVINTAGADIGGPFTLTDTSGKRVSDRDFRGRYMLIYFGYSYCPDVCPTELQAMGRALDLAGPAGDRIVPVFITVDPARDKGKDLADYVRAFHPRMIGLTGAREDIDAVTKAYRVYYKLGAPSKPGAMDYLVDHTSFVYLIGPDGKLAALFRGNSGADALAEGIKGALR
jgi:protein SCO1/2